MATTSITRMMSVSPSSWNTFFASAYGIESFRKDMGEFVTEIHRERVDSARREASARREFVQGLTKVGGGPSRPTGRTAPAEAEPPARFAPRAEAQTRESPAQRARKRNRAA